ncbi:hypothetical protein DSO57_1002439 [Entomophthora muscae]|uniref:Uncharacterized protein n=1 Tax=Entomophthora muscae TaxID=34485 RepID=A0ACC2RZM3_9FUNG|nr:hypothetical protein DSO57_1002439 [Entomophthora muscae]
MVRQFNFTPNPLVTSRSDHPFSPPNPLASEETSFGPFGVNVLKVNANRINPKRKRLLMDRGNDTQRTSILTYSPGGRTANCTQLFQTQYTNLYHGGT